MKLFITGASGFLGQYVVAAALRQGHEVMAVVRAKTQIERFSWHSHPRLSIVRHDLRVGRGLADALGSADVVIHLAATKAGDFYTQFGGTVLATENLLRAMAERNVQRLVAISTFSVYDNQAMRTGQLLDETAPTVSDAKNRDEYAQTKRIQEQLYRDFEQNRQAQVTILRPGMIYGRDCLWHALIGAEFGSRWVKVGGRGQLPMIYVENCAEAIVRTVDQPAAWGQTLNLVDDDLPTVDAYTQQVLDTGCSPHRLAVSWAFVRALAGLAWWVNQTWLGGQAKLPGILVPAKVHGRFKPLRYTNTQAKQVLGWQPQYDMKTAFARSCCDRDLLTVTPIAEPLSLPVRRERSKAAAR
ncbi:MAG: NAD(P)-dependent oxidoreductase [Cyanobacteria bacterium J06648_16]